MKIMKKILITGNAGSGKTTLTRQLTKILNRTNSINLDKIVWKPGWLLTEKNEREMALEKIAREKSWIVDGVSKKILGEADTIIFLDYPKHICYWRVFCRNRKYLFKSRPELPEECPEIRILKKLIQIIWKFQRDVRPTILKHLNENAETKKIFHITNNKQLQSVIDLFIKMSAFPT